MYIYIYICVFQSVCISVSGDKKQLQKLQYNINFISSLKLNKK